MDAWTVLGIFLLGASVGALLTAIAYAGQVRKLDLYAVSSHPYLIHPERVMPAPIIWLDCAVVGRNGSVIIGIGWWSVIGQKVFRREWRRDGLKAKRSLLKVEAIRKIVRRRIGISERRQVIDLFDELQNGAEIVGRMGNVSRSGVR